MERKVSVAEQKLADLQRLLKEKEQENRIGKLKIKELRRIERQKQVMPGFKMNTIMGNRESIQSLPPIQPKQYNPYE
jgi:hypothetical protein